MRKTNDEIILKMLKEGKTQRAIAKYFGVSDVAIHKRVKRLMPKPKSLEKLTAKQQKFALAVADGQTKTNAALEAFDCNSRNSAKTLGVNLMKDNDICTAINEVMQSVGLTRRYRVKRLKEHIDSVDPNISLRGLDQSWRLDGGYVDRVEVDSRNVDIVVATANLETIQEQLKQLRSAKERLLRKQKPAG